MANIPPKKLTLRAFRIENPNLTEAHSGILGAVTTGFNRWINSSTTSYDIKCRRS